MKAKYNVDDDTVNIEEDPALDTDSSKENELLGKSVEKLIEPSILDIFYQQIGIGVGLLYQKFNEAKSNHFQFPRRKKLYEKVQGKRTPIEGINKHLDAEGVDLTKQEYKAFFKQAQVKESDLPAAIERLIDTFHETCIRDALDKTALDHKKEAKRLVSMGLFSREQADFYKRNISVAKAGSLMHKAYQIGKVLASPAYDGNDACEGTSVDDFMNFYGQDYSSGKFK